MVLLKRHEFYAQSEDRSQATSFSLGKSEGKRASSGKGSWTGPSSCSQLLCQCLPRCPRLLTFLPGALGRCGQTAAQFHADSARSEWHRGCTMPGVFTCMCTIIRSFDCASSPPRSRQGAGAGRWFDTRSFPPGRAGHPCPTLRATSLSGICR